MRHVTTPSLCRQHWRHYYARGRRALSSQAVHYSVPDPSPPQEDSRIATTSDGHQRTHERKHGHRALPLPPLMDEACIAAKERFRYPFRAPTPPSWEDQEKTEFQREFEANTYVRALATRIRLCQVTKARLPAHFLLPVTAQLLPETTGKSGPRAQLRVLLEPDPTVDAVLTSQSHAYVLAKRSVLEYLGTGYRYTLLCHQRLREWLARKMATDVSNIDPQKHFSWDKSTPEDVLAQFRRSVIQQVHDLFEQEGNWAVPLSNAQPSEVSKLGVACLIRLHDDGDLDLGYDSNTGIYAYDATQLLGDTLSSELVALFEAATTDTRWLAIRATAKTVALRTTLDQLDAYQRPFPFDHRQAGTVR